MGKETAVKKTSTSWFYYSGNSVHPFFKEEYKSLKTLLDITASNKAFDQTTTIAKEMQDAKGVVHKKKPQPKIIKFLRWCALEVWCWIGLPKVAIAHTNAQSVWSCGYLVLNKPFIVTFEDSSVFFYHRYHLCNRVIIRLLTNWLLSRKNCIAIVPWTNAAKNSFTALFTSEKIAKKIHVLYPTISPVEKAKQLPFSKRKHILFVGQAFKAKGGYDLLYALQRLPNINAEIVSVNYPQKARELAATMPHVTLRENVTYAQLRELHKHAKVFVLPTHMDTLGFSYLEAMSYGTPCIGLKHFATPEIITNNKTGLLAPTTLSYFDSTYVNRKNGGNQFWTDIENKNEQTVVALVNAIKTLYTNQKRWTMMHNATLVELESGKFSRKNWTARVKKITSQ